MNEDKLTQAVKEELETLISTESVIELLRENVNKTLKSEIESLFSYNGIAKKQIQQFLQDNISFDFSSLTVENHNDIMLKLLEQALTGMVDNELEAKTKKLLNEIICQAPEVINMSEIIEAYKQYITENFDSEIREIDPDDGHTHCLEIEYDLEQDYKYGSFRDFTLSCGSFDIPELKIHLYFYTGMGDSAQEYIKITYSYFGDKASGKKMDIKNWSKVSELEKLLFKIETADTQILLDEDKYNCEIEVERECEC